MYSEISRNDKTSTTLGNYILKCNYLSGAIRTKLTNQNIIWEQMIVTLHVNGLMTLKFMYTNHTLTTKFETNKVEEGCRPLRKLVHGLIVH